MALLPRGIGIPKMLVQHIVAALLLTAALDAQTVGNHSSSGIDDADARPPVTKADLEIAKQARKILNSQTKWNRLDTRDCEKRARLFSLYCALEKATEKVSGHFEHRGAAMQEARFVIEEVEPEWERKYHHLLMDYNNDPKTTFADIQKVFRLLEERIEKRMKKNELSDVRPTNLSQSVVATNQKVMIPQTVK